MVIAIVAILAAVTLPAVQMAREAARRATCHSNLRQVGLAMQMYVGAHGVFPQGRPPGGLPADHLLPGRLGLTGRSAFVAVLPYLDGQAVYDRFNFSTPWFHSTVNHTAELGRPGVFVCPSDSMRTRRRGSPTAHFPLPDPPGETWPVALTQYGVMQGNFIISRDVLEMTDPTQADGVLNDLPGVAPAEITDGLARTAIVSERNLAKAHSQGTRGVDGRWSVSFGLDTLLRGTHPPNAMLKVDRRHPKFGFFLTNPSSAHPGGVSLLFADGSVRLAGDATESWPIDPDTWYAPCNTPRLCDTPYGVWQAYFSRANGD